MQVFIVQAFLKKQDLWEGPIDGRYSEDLGTTMDKYLEAQQLSPDSGAGYHKKLLLVEQVLYKQLGTLDKVTGENSEEFQLARSKYLAQMNKSNVIPSNTNVSASDNTPTSATPSKEKEAQVIKDKYYDPC